MKIVLKSANNVKYELQTLNLGDGSFSTILVPARPETPEHYCVTLDSTEEKSFPGHAGRPGHRGGSLPRNNAKASAAQDSARQSIFSTKDINKFLNLHGITPSTVDKLPEELYNSVRTYIITHKIRKSEGSVSLPPSGPKLRAFIGDEKYAKLQEFKKTYYKTDKVKRDTEFEGAERAYIEKHVKFASDIRDSMKELVINTLIKYKVSPDVIDSLKFVSDKPPKQYYTETVSGNWKRNNMPEGEKVTYAAGVCLSDSEIYINPYGMEHEKKNTILHELGHVAERLPKSSRMNRSRILEALETALGKLQDEMAENHIETLGKLHSLGLREYSLTNESEFFADIYLTMKTTGKVYGPKLTELVGSQAITAISKL